MKNRKKPIIFAITLFIAGLVIASSVSINATIEVKNTKENSIVKVPKLDNNFLEMYPKPIPMVSKHNIDYASNLLTPKTRGTDLPIMVHPEGNDIENPNMLEDLGDNIVVMAEAHLDVMTSSPFIRYSNDGGNSWLPEDDFLIWSGMEDYYEERPCIDFAGDRGGFGSMIPIEPLYLCTVDFDDISDPDAGDQWGLWSWLTDEEVDSLDVCGVNSEFAPSPEARGMVVRTGDDVTGADNILYIGWMEGDVLRGLWTGNSDDLLEWENVDCDIDLGTGLHFETYEVYDYEGYPDGVELDWCQMDGTGDWWTNNDWYWTGGIIEGATNPDIKADNGNVYLVYELDGGINCLYSNDNADTFNEVVITFDGHLPTITAVGEIAVCSYIRDGDLYTSISEDGGSYWEEEPKVNDESGTVVDQQNCNDVSGVYIVWTDNRITGQDSIFFDKTVQTGSPPSTPMITGPTKFRPNQNQEFTFTATDPDGDQLYYSVEWGDGSVLDWQGPFTSGTPFKASHSWADRDLFTIRCKAKDTNELQSGFGTLDVSTPKNIGFMSRLLDYIQHVFPDLYKILGL
jgi:hypothetical protein